MVAVDTVSVSYEPQQRPEHVLQDGVRLDGRGFEEFRNLFIHPGALQRAAGSAYVEMGSTKVMAGVFGPRESERRTEFSERGRLSCDVRLATFSARQRRQAGLSEEEREIGALALTALESAVRKDAFPKANVDVFCLVMQAGGAELAAVINAGATALADAGIPMNDLVSACAVSRVDGHLLLDPTSDESYRGDAGCTVAMLPASNKVSQLVVTGEWTSASLNEVLELAMGGCLQIDSVMRQSLRATVTQ